MLCGFFKTVRNNKLSYAFACLVKRVNFLEFCGLFRRVPRLTMMKFLEFFPKKQKFTEFCKIHKFP